MVMVGLLIWLNLIARLALISAAWVANNGVEIRSSEPRIQVQALTQVTDTMALPGMTTVAGRGSLPAFGERSRDVTTLGSRLILGAAAMAATER